MPLTLKQKRLLKQRGQTLADGCQLGKARLTDEFLDHLNQLLDRDGLVKMRFTELEGSARKELAKAVCRAVDAECVQVVGRTVLMYRPTPGKADPGGV